MNLSIERLFSRDSIWSLVAITLLAAGIVWLDFADDPFREAAIQALYVSPEIVDRFGEVRDVSLRKKTTLFRETGVGREQERDRVRYLFDIEGDKGDGSAAATVQISDEDRVESIAIELRDR